EPQNGWASRGCRWQPSSGSRALARSCGLPSSSAPVGAVAAATPRSAAPEAILARQLVAEPLELAFSHPTDLERVDLRVAMKAAPTLRAALVEVDVGQHVAPAERAAGHGEACLLPPHAGDPCDAHERATSGRRPMSVSSRRMCS